MRRVTLIITTTTTKRIRKKESLNFCLVLNIAVKIKSLIKFRLLPYALALRDTLLTVLFLETTMPIYCAINVAQFQS